MPEIRLQETVTSVLLPFSLAPLACCSDGSWLPCCELPHGEAHIVRNRGQPPADSQWRWKPSAQ